MNKHFFRDVEYEVVDSLQNKMNEQAREGNCLTGEIDLKEIVSANSKKYECDVESSSRRRSKFREIVDAHGFRAISVIIVILYGVYLGFALFYDAEGAVFVCLLGVTLCITISVRVFHVDYVNLLSKLKHKCTCTNRPLAKRIKLVIKWCLILAASLSLLAFLIVDAVADPEKLKPLGGLTLFVVLLWATSTSPLKVRWIPVITGLLMQFAMGIFILRWNPGYAACKFLGDSVTSFLGYTDYASKFVFGDPGYTMHAVVFQILPVVVFFSSVVSILYYLGALQFVIKIIALVLEYIMQTSPIESFATAAHIFIGQVESSVALAPFLYDVTDSELNAVMTSGYATVAGTVIAAYIAFGVPATHVISASFMSAPAALAVAKLNYPELERSPTNKDVHIELEVGKESNLIEAASAGAISSIKLVAYVVVNLIAFFAILAFLDATVSYFAGRVGYPEVTFEYLCSYIFMPLAVIMGVPWAECRIVGKLIGKKILVNEFLAYADLGKLITEQNLEPRTAVISTYILCGFGSIAAMGINLGALSAAEPRKRQSFTKLLLRALVLGNVSCFMTACVAGTLYQDITQVQLIHNVTAENSSLSNTTGQPLIISSTSF